jgi:hypothetical protein
LFLKKERRETRVGIGRVNVSEVLPNFLENPPSFP